MNDRYTYDDKIISTYSDTTQPHFIVFTAYWFDKATPDMLVDFCTFLKTATLVLDGRMNLYSYYIKTVYSHESNSGIHLYEVTKETFEAIQAKTMEWVASQETHAL